MSLISSALHIFRSALRNVFPYNKDTAVELIDAISSNGSASSVAELSLYMERNYSSISYCISDYYKPRGSSPDNYKKEKLAVDKNIENTLCRQIGDINSNLHTFAVDVTPYKRSYAKKLHGKSYIHDSSGGKIGIPVSIGHKYSTVGYITNDNHWVLPVSIKELSVNERESSYGVKQWLDVVNDPKNGFQDKASVGVFDAAYSNAYGVNAFIENKQSKSIFISRLRTTRILMRPYRDASGKIEQDKKNLFDLDHPFNLSNESTWDDPIEITTTEWKTKRGKLRTVKIQKWNNIRMRGHDDCKIQKTPLTVIRISVVDENNKNVYKNPLWLLAVGDIEFIKSLKQYWLLYKSRFDIEHFFRFGKQKMLLDVFQTPDQLSENNWMLFPMIAYHQLYHARNVAQEVYRPWDKKRKKDNDHKSLSPTMTQRDMGRILNSMPRITLENKPRGISSGRPEGELSNHREDSPVIRKTLRKKEEDVSIEIIPPSGKDRNNSKPKIKFHGIEESDISPELSSQLDKIKKVSSFIHAQAP